MNPGETSLAIDPVPMGQFNVIDVFAGIGGMTLGFKQSSRGFAARLLVDKDPTARESFILNCPEIPYIIRDVHDVSGSNLKAAAGLAPTDTVHVLVGGPPCQGFSWLGKRSLDDPRNVHLVDFVRLVREIRPLVALMENVPLVITSHDGSIVNELVESLRSFNYSVVADTLLASDYGVPQYRKRAFIMAYRSDMKTSPSFPLPTHERLPNAATSRSDVRMRFDATRLPYVSVEEAIGDLPPLMAGQGDEVATYRNRPATPYQAWARKGSIALFNHRSRAHGASFLKKVGVIAEGGRNQELPPDQRFSDNYFSQAYARLHRNGIAQTVTTCFGNPGSGRFLHYRDLRSLTVREAGRLQSFSDEFVFHGTHSDQMRHVGNAVPPLLAKALADHIATALTAHEVDKLRGPGRPAKRPVETPEARSRIMRAVPAKNSSAEIALRKALWAAGIRGYRLHDKTIPGTPDLVFRNQKLAVFVDGCFWHGCEKCYRAPNTRQDYWQTKVTRNRERDAKVTAQCEELGWRTIRLWEHDVLKKSAESSKRIARALRRKA